MQNIQNLRWSLRQCNIDMLQNILYVSGFAFFLQDSTQFLNKDGTSLRVTIRDESFKQDNTICKSCVVFYRSSKHTLISTKALQGVPHIWKLIDCRTGQRCRVRLHPNSGHLGITLTSGHNKNLGLTAQRLVHCHPIDEHVLQIKMTVGRINRLVDVAV